MEASALQQTARLPALAGRSPLLRLQSDEKLVALIRRGHHGAFEALVQRYQPRLLAFCRHMLSSREDAEDVLQEVFAAAFNAICADERPINARPWLYRIARNRCLNHLRRPQHSGQDSMDVFERDGGITTADTVHQREEFRHIVGDVQELPETQRTALLLREIDALTYEQIAEAMDTTVPSVKSLLVRARVALAEAAEARLLTCDEVRLELGGVAEGITRTSAPIRRHLKTCERCRTFRSELRRTSKALAAIYPIGPFLIFKKLWIAKLGLGGAAGAAASSSGGAAAGGMAGAAAGAAGGITAGGAMSAGVSTIATKAAAGMAAAVIVTAGAVEVKHVNDRPAAPPPQVAQALPVAAPSVAAAPAPVANEKKALAVETGKKMTARPAEEKAAAVPPTDPAATTPEDATAVPPTAPVQEDGSTVTLPPPDREVLTQPETMPVAQPPTTTTPAETPAPSPEDTSADTLPAAPVEGQSTPGTPVVLPKDTLEPAPTEEQPAPAEELGPVD
ncbi:MAG: sigma-70 family RNA polymerase sigma factor [Thermoleophilaceae bacterium]|nr:sigma-70 family RNA polymerase sigma factor [Thermoleophilaceae bacterium]